MTTILPDHGKNRDRSLCHCVQRDHISAERAPVGSVNTQGKTVVISKFINQYVDIPTYFS
jgi:hypothetical protein